MFAFHTIFRFKRILHHASFHTLFRRAFIDSISRQLAAGRALTANQVEKLDEIWERATARG